MNFFKKVCQCCESVFRKARMAQARKAQSKLESLSCEVINVVEFSGRLYVSYEGVPIVRLEDLKEGDEAPSLLVQARADFLAWKSKFNK